ncbi:MAG: adenosine deaminase [Mobilicoccus sp.]|nr:adenosine deaminase [Mobilicoccus sp.]
MTDSQSEYDDTVPGREDTDTRISAEESDDLPVSPPDRQPRTAGDDGGDASEAETIEERIMQEEPDPDSAYGAPEDESGLDGPAPLGGDDPDAIPAQDDVLGGSVHADALEPSADEDTTLNP